MSCPDCAGPLSEIQFTDLKLSAAYCTPDFLTQHDGCFPGMMVGRSRLNSTSPKGDLAEPHVVVEIEEGAAVWRAAARS